MKALLIRKLTRVFGILLLMLTAGLMVLPGCNSKGGEVQERLVYKNWNLGQVQRGTAAAAAFELKEAYAVTMIATYHWYGIGQPAGSITLKEEKSGKEYTWTAMIDTNANKSVWVVNFKTPGIYEDYRSELGRIAPDKSYPVLPAGSYTVTDSNPGTWSFNAESGGQGFFQIQGYKIRESK